MTLSKRVLTKWRKIALQENTELIKSSVIPTIALRIATNDRILTMTQELLDQHLLKEINKDGQHSEP